MYSTNDISELLMKDYKADIVMKQEFGSFALACDAIRNNWTNIARIDLFKALNYESKGTFTPELKKYLTAIVSKDNHWHFNVNDIFTSYTELLNSVQELLCDQFVIPYETPEMKLLFDYISERENMCIAGGYPTIHYVGKDLAHFLQSDIDIFIMNMVDHDFQKTFKELIDFLNNTFVIDKIVSRHSLMDKSHAVFDVICKKLPRPVQIIGSTTTNIAGLLNSFDSPHSKCCFYNGKTYITLDAKYSKDLKITWFYGLGNEITKLRTDKALKLGFNVINPTNKNNCGMVYVDFTVDEAKFTQLAMINSRYNTTQY